MALFRNLKCRALMIDGRKSITLEPHLWPAADRLSKAQGASLQSWAFNKLTKDQRGRASVLRVAIL